LRHIVGDASASPHDRTTIASDLLTTTAPNLRSVQGIIDGFPQALPESNSKLVVPDREAPINKAARDRVNEWSLILVGVADEKVELWGQGRLLVERLTSPES
jgi:hypothetical protein